MLFYCPLPGFLLSFLLPSLLPPTLQTLSSQSLESKLISDIFSTFLASKGKCKKKKKCNFALQQLLKDSENFALKILLSSSSSSPNYFKSLFVELGHNPKFLARARRAGSTEHTLQLMEFHASMQKTTNAVSCSSMAKFLEFCRLVWIN